MAERTRCYKQDGTEYDFSKEPEIKITQTSNADMNIGIPKKLTAVGWLESQLDWLSRDMSERDRISLFEQAKQMEKEQIQDAWHDGNFLGRNGLILEEYSTGKQYYKEKYGTA